MSYSFRRDFQLHRRRCVSAKSQKSSRASSLFPWLGITACLSYPLILAHEASQMSTKGILRMAGRQPGPTLSAIFDITGTCFILYHTIAAPLIMVVKLMCSRLLQNQAEGSLSSSSIGLGLSLFFLMTFKTNKQTRWQISLLLRMLILLLLKTLSSAYIPLIPFVIAGAFERHQAGLSRNLNQSEEIIELKE